MEETAPGLLGKLCQIENAALFQCSTRSYYWLEHRKVSLLYTNWEMQLFVSINSYSMLVLIGKVWTLVIAINMLFMNWRRQSKDTAKQQDTQYGSAAELLALPGWTVQSGFHSDSPFRTTPGLKHLCSRTKPRHFRLIRLKLATYRCEALNNKEQRKDNHFQKQAVCQHQGLWRAKLSETAKCKPSVKTGH